jgi:hypothetical protein
MKFRDFVNIGFATIIVDVGGTAPLSLTGTIDKTITLNRKDHPIFPPKIVVEGEITEEEQFLILDVTAAVLPTGFPLTLAQLTAGDVAINIDSIILVLPVEA